MKVIFTLSLLVSLSALAGPHGVPPELKSQLTADQISKLESVSSLDERRKLLDSWGIKPPPRHDHGLPPFIEGQLTADQKTQLQNAKSMDEKVQLLQSWGIKMPPPPVDRARDVAPSDSENSGSR